MDQGDYGLCLYQQERKTGKETKQQKEREGSAMTNCRESLSEWEKIYKREEESMKIR